MEKASEPQPRSGYASQSFPQSAPIARKPVSGHPFPQATEEPQHAAAPATQPHNSAIDKETQVSTIREKLQTIPTASSLDSEASDHSFHNIEKPSDPNLTHNRFYSKTLPALPPHSESISYAHTTPTASKPLPFYHNLQRKWTRLPKRTRYIILAAVLAFLILIIGLSAGLSSRSRSKFTSLPLPSSHGGPYTGDLTYYDPALGSCGITSTSSDFIVAVSHYLYDAVQVGSNPNSNPLCGKKIRANRGGKSVDLTVVDRCTGCQPRDLDVTRTVFQGLADIDQGRVPVTWAWLEDVPGGVAGS